MLPVRIGAGSQAEYPVTHAVPTALARQEKIANQRVQFLGSITRSACEKVRKEVYIIYVKVKIVGYLYRLILVA